jgi:hypothetical protein
LQIFFLFAHGFFNGHVIKFFRIKDFTALKAFDELGVLVPGDDSYSRVLANGRHRSGIGLRVFGSLSADCIGLSFKFKRQNGVTRFYAAQGHPLLTSIMKG